MKKIYWTGPDLQNLSTLFSLMQIQRDFAMQARVFYWIAAKTNAKPGHRYRPCSVLLQWDESGVDRENSRIQFF